MLVMSSTAIIDVWAFLNDLLLIAQSYQSAMINHQNHDQPWLIKSYQPLLWHRWCQARTHVHAECPTWADAASQGQLPQLPPPKPPEGVDIRHTFPMVSPSDPQSHQWCPMVYAQLLVPTLLGGWPGSAHSSLTVGLVVLIIGCSFTLSWSIFLWEDLFRTRSAALFTMLDGQDACRHHHHHHHFLESQFNNLCWSSGAAHNSASVHANDAARLDQDEQLNMGCLLIVHDATTSICNWTINASKVSPIQD